MGSCGGCAAAQAVKKKQRTHVLELFIDVARECFNIGNFNSMMAIVCECLGWASQPASVWSASPALTPPALPCSRHEPQSCGKAEEDVVQSQDSQV